MKTGRNDPCPCGSGVKFKKCCLNKKSRTTAVVVDYGEPKTINGISVDSKSGEVTFMHEGQPVIPKSARIETSYPRNNKGAKILFRAPLLNEDNLILNPNNIVRDFDLVYAIDTNTRKIKEAQISLAAIILGKMDSLDANVFLYAPVHCLELRNIEFKPENVAWKLSIEMIQRNLDFRSTLKVALIVDSDLDNLKRYNSGETPIYGNFYLPSNFKFVYASADVKKENIPNKLIRVADKESSQLLDFIMHHDVGKDLCVVENEPYTHFRFWNCEKS
ncbi:MAG: SEC-C domain-containing protein [Syntrophales bacterium]|nr:SEC-C domain-containing protein [Syntrophales bacterium]